MRRRDLSPVVGAMVCFTAATAVPIVTSGKIARRSERNADILFHVARGDRRAALRAAAAERGGGMHPAFIERRGRVERRRSAIVWILGKADIC